MIPTEKIEPVPRSAKSSPPSQKSFTSSIDSTASRLDGALARPLTRVGWSLALLLVLGGLALLVAHGPARTDADQLEPVARSILRLDLRHAYSPTSTATSPPGYALVVALPLGLVELACGCDAYLWIGLFTVPLLLAASLWLAHRSGVRFGSTASALVLVGVLFAPGVLQSLTEAYHPQDLLALALVLGATALMTRQGASTSRASVMAAGAFVGLACATRQWAVLPAALIVFRASPNRGWLVLAASAMALLVLVPFALSDLGGLAQAMRAGSVVQSFTLIGRLPIGLTTTRLLARVGPLALGGAFIVTLARRGGPQRDTIVLELLAICTSRLLFEPVVYRYYLAPCVVLALCWCATKSRRLIVTGLVLAFVVNVRDLAIGGGVPGLVGAIGLELTLASVFAASALWSRRAGAKGMASSGWGSGADEECR